MADELLRHLAAALAIVTKLFSPGLVLLGGIFSSASDRLIAAVHERTKDQVFPLLRVGLRIERAAEGAAVSGAATLALEKFYYG